MIKRFDHKGLEKIVYDSDKRHIRPAQVQKFADLLDKRDALVLVQDMNYPGANLHQLKSRLKKNMNCKLFGKWIMAFTFIEGNAYVVEYQD